MNHKKIENKPALIYLKKAHRGTPDSYRSHQKSELIRSCFQLSAKQFQKNSVLLKINLYT